MSQSTHFLDHQALFNDPRYFAQIESPSTLPSEEEYAGKPWHDVVYDVASRLVGTGYQLEKPKEWENPIGDELQVFDALTQILPKLSDQSIFHWHRTARAIAALLEGAKYPVKAQTSHLVFWWARLGGLNGVTKLGRTKSTRTMWFRDGSNTEISWVIPHKTSPDETGNRHVRFTIDPFHPESGLRLAGGALIDWLWGWGSMGLVENDEGTKDWKEIIEKWLFPEIPNSEWVVGNCHYSIGFDLEPSGLIQLKSYYVPPRKPLTPDGPIPKAGTIIANPKTLHPVETLLPLLHPSLKEPFDLLTEYLAGVEKSGLRFLSFACDVTKEENNRLKLYMWPTIAHSLNDTIRDLTLGGRIQGPGIDDAIANVRKLYKRLFPGNGDDDKMVARDGGVGGLLFYYELFVGERYPGSKVYFDMSSCGINDYETTKSVEAFFADVGKPGVSGKEGWYTKSVQRTCPYRPLSSRPGAQTGVTFGMKPKGWQVTGYITPEAYAPERGIGTVDGKHVVKKAGEEPEYTWDELVKEYYKIFTG
ncbi:dimethylallyl tryptophan synthase 2 [Moniliophthora roreri MCA 2997]|uniref:Dimethylallyl tryptophan synthase 2 n=2 Tax=Moniliophthora roreri TaxID=221103 RepID=V2WT25_MONRO|nr:dimethylallyl tryptophan synthase 2 [Moniliophthora roreri MCA 2997]KAI3604631.1 dimethylallyl tryptophan synthase 2 [Moniliophthora roreri]